MSELNEFGQEVFDQTPVNYPIKFDRPTPIHLRIREQILALNEEMRHQNEFETPEEADDFGIPDDDTEFNSQYELDFDHIMQGDVSKEVSDETSGGTSQTERSEVFPSSDSEKPGNEA